MAYGQLLFLALDAWAGFEHFVFTNIYFLPGQVVIKQIDSIARHYFLLLWAQVFVKIKSDGIVLYETCVHDVP